MTLCQNWQQSQEHITWWKWIAQLCTMHGAKCVILPSSVEDCSRDNTCILECGTAAKAKTITPDSGDAFNYISLAFALLSH